MPIFDMDPKSTHWGDHHPQFRVQCDCAGQGEHCPSITHSYWDYGKDSDSNDIMYVSAAPDPYPWKFWERIKYAWHILWYGTPPYVDDMCLFPETLEAWAGRLNDAAKTLRESKYNNYRYEKVKINPNK